jgi:hypothetical protein
MSNDSPQREDGSEEQPATVSLSAARDSTDLPHLERACELLWQAGHPRIAEALEAEVNALLAQRDRYQRVLYVPGASSEDTE